MKYDSVQQEQMPFWPEKSSQLALSWFEFLPPVFLPCPLSVLSLNMHYAVVFSPSHSFYLYLPHSSRSLLTFLTCCITPPLLSSTPYSTFPWNVCVISCWLRSRQAIMRTSGKCERHFVFKAVKRNEVSRNRDCGSELLLHFLLPVSPLWRSLFTH